MAPKEPNPSWRHHVVQAAYLEAFTDRTGQLWVHGKLGERFQQLPKNVAWRDNFYTLPHDSNPEYLEQYLAHVPEAISNDIHKSLLLQLRLTGGLPTPDQRADLSLMAALQALRTPRMRDFLLQMASEARTEGVTLTDEHLALYAHAAILDWQQSSSLLFICRVLDSRAISFLSTTLEHPFWTSDDPVALIDLRENVGQPTLIPEYLISG